MSEPRERQQPSASDPTINAAPDAALEAMASLGEALVRDAGAQMLERLGAREVRVKAPFDLVTEVDMAVQRRVSDRLRTAYPDHALLGEEQLGEKQRDGAEPSAVDTGYCWVLDPLDGTVNYAFDLPFYSVSLALLHEGVPVLGWVFDPLHDELFTARRGAGARLNGRVMSPPAQRTALPVGISTGLLEHWAHADGGQEAMRELIARYGKLRLLGSQALHLCYVAAGRLSAAINMEAKLWDDAAGALIVWEAGGRYTDVRGNEVFPLRSQSPLVRGASISSLAGDPAVHADLLRLLPPAAST